MHIADGLLDLTVLIPLWIIVIVYGIFAVKKVRETIGDDKIPLIGVLTAMVFAFQMLNFPVAAGTSGHLLGFVLMAVLITPSAAFLMITVILLIQALIFADGGLLALGANIFNMGIVALAGYYIYYLIIKISSKSESESTKKDKILVLAAFIGAYCSVVFASLVCGLEIGLSSSFPYGVEITVPVMVGIHALIGIGEGLITALVIVFFQKYAPEYLPETKDIPVWS